jgi:hypothetical protein
MSRRPAEVSEAALAWELTDAETVARYHSEIRVVRGRSS